MLLDFLFLRFLMMPMGLLGPFPVLRALRSAPSWAPVLGRPSPVAGSGTPLLALLLMLGRRMVLGMLLFLGVPMGLGWRILL